MDHFQKTLSNSAPTVAPSLLGSILIRQIDGQELVGRIVETEAYDQHDAASHSYRGVTPRTKVMFGPAGYAYVYFTYGLHYCLNIVSGKTGNGEAVLVRAIEPIAGVELMKKNRHQQDITNLTNGPAKLCQALSINNSLNGHDLRVSPLQILLKPSLPKSEIIQTKRIGITKDTDRLWRYCIRGNPFVSRK